MRPLGTPPTPRAVSRAGLPVEITAVTGGGPSKVLATPAPRRRSTSASAAARSWVGAAPGGGASWTVAVGMGVGLLADGEIRWPRRRRMGWLGTADRLLLPS